MPSLSAQDFETRYREFDGLDPVAQGDARKGIIRALEADLRRRGTLDLANTDIGGLVAGDSQIDRILVYLLIEQGQLAAAPGDLRRYLEAEWDRLSREGFRPACSRQPLHYALRAYETGLRIGGPSRQQRDDVAFFDAMLERLDRSSVDAGSRVQEKATELRNRMAAVEPDRKRMSTEVKIALIALIGTLGAALIAAVWGGS